MFGSCLKQWLLGQTVDQADWLIGAGLFMPGVSARGLRDMAHPGTAYDDPQLGKDPQGASMDDYIETTDDNGGVHLNSGIPNRAFHLAATALGGHAWESAGAIWYAAITGAHVGPDTDFAGFAAATVAAAGDREQGWADAVRQAWETVGVTPDDGSTTAPTTGEPVSDESLVVVRRTGGFAGRTTEGAVDLTSHDARVPEVRSLVDRIDLAHVPGGNPHPDMFVYDFNLCGRCAQVPEQHLTPDLSRLAVIVLEAGNPSALNTDSSEVAPHGEPQDRDESGSGQGPVEGGVDVERGAGEHRQLDVGLRDEQLDLGAAEQDRSAPASQSSSVSATTRRRVASTTRPCTSSS